jgi:UDP-hydrolysing UDP-N-acetyl-D-glucosamine 2-epimerase
MINNRKRKICFIITSFIHYSRNLLILEELQKRDDIDLHIIIGGTALLSKYSARHAHIRELLEADGFKNLYEVYFNLEGDNNVVKAKTAGLGMIEFSLLFNNMNPDLVVVRGDRFEVLSAATAAFYMNIPIAHIEGGDVTGTLDESIRHSITKLAHLHFATNDQAYERILKMGEPEKYVFNFGSPDIEVAKKFAGDNKKTYEFEHTGSGAHINPKKGYIMVMYHPVSTEVESLGSYTRELLRAVHELAMPTLWFWPNFDAGAEHISRELRTFNDNEPTHQIKFMRYVPPRQFLALLAHTKCLIGNSSAGIKECSYLGIPVVNIGSRQNNRLRSDNVIDAVQKKVQIKRAIRTQLTKGKFKPSTVYHANGTSKKIAAKLATAQLYVQKSFTD